MSFENLIAMKKPECRVKFRETGNSLLMGLVKVSPSEFDNYYNELEKTLDDWRTEAKRNADNSPTVKGEIRAWSDPDHFFKAGIFSTLGSWDLVHFTLTFDQGLATRLPYIGHAIGQQMYYLNDLSIKMHADTKTMPSKNDVRKEDISFFEALERIGITFCFCYDTLEELENATSGDSNLFNEEILINRDASDFNDTDSDDKQYINQLKEKDRIGNYYYSVVKSAFDLATIGTTTSVKCPTKKRHNDNSIKPTDLLSVFQLNKNPNFKFTFSRENRIIVYLLMVYKLAQFWITHDSKKEQISFVKPFFTDNFFDIAVIFRGTNLNLIKEMMTEAMLITKEDITKFHRLTTYTGKKGETKTLFNEQYMVDKFVNSTPLYHLSYNFDGFPYHMISEIQGSIKKSFSDECPLEYQKKRDIIICHKDRCHKNTYRCCVEQVYYTVAEKYKVNSLSNRKDNDHCLEYNGELGSYNNQTDLVKPSILVAIQADYQKQVYKQLKLWNKVTCKILTCEPSIKIEEVQGRYSFEIRFRNDIPTPKFILAFSFLTYFLPRECNRKSLKLIAYPIESRKIYNPILQFKSKLHAKYITHKKNRGRKSLCFPFDKIVNAPYKGHTCLLNKVKILQICYEAAEHLQLMFLVPNKTDNFDYDIFYNKNGKLFSNLSDHTQREEDKIFSTNRANIVKAVRNNLCYSIYKIDRINSDKPFQSEFNKYLQKRFQGQVTPETLELLFSNLCALDSYISSQISYYLFLDIRKYTIEFIALLCSVYQCTDADGNIHDVYWDHKNKTIKCCLHDDQASVIKGLEYQIISFISTIEKITSQKLSGSHPQHDRNFSRLADIRVLQNKKIEGISWLINSCCKHFSQTYKTILTEEAKLLSLDSIHFQELDDSIPHHLPVFSNSPDMVLSKPQKTIGINVRNLASIEGLTLVTHEIGHILADSLLKRRHKSIKKLFEQLKDNIEESKEKGKEITSEGPISIDDQVPIVTEQIAGLDFDRIYNKAIMEELFCDLYTCNISFAPLKLFYNGNNFRHLCPGIDKNEKQQRVESYNKELSDTHLYDQIDDFCLSFIHQAVRLPQIITNEGFYNLMIRITFLVGIVKFYKNKDNIKNWNSLFNSNNNNTTVSEAVDIIWDKFICPFYFEKLNLLLVTVYKREVLNMKSNEDGVHDDYEPTEEDFIKYGPKVQQPQLLNKLRLTIKKKKSEQLSEVEELNYIPRYFNQMKTIFKNYFIFYLKACSTGEPFFLYLQKLAKINGLEKNENGVPTKVPSLFKKVNDPYLVRDGLPTKETGELSSIDRFCHSLQLCGAINLRFSASTENPHLVVHGNLGFKDHASQQYLSRSRRLATTFLWNGALLAIKNEIESVNNDHNQWWTQETDEEGKLIPNMKRIFEYKETCARKSTEKNDSDEPDEKCLICEGERCGITSAFIEN